MISIIVPTLNEEAVLGSCLRQARRAAPHAEIIVVDGGSTDRTVEIADAVADAVLQSSRGRGRQMNAGARQARGRTLLFLHADTLLPDQIVEDELEQAFGRPGVIGGNFRVRYAPESPGAAMLGILAGWIRRIGLFFGDSAIFVRRDLFLARGGFQQENLMEDVELARWLRRTGRTVQIHHPVTTSTRRFRGRLPWHVFLWLLLHTLYYCGVPDRLLVRLYAPGR